jgi:hypothetical protein
MRHQMTEETDVLSRLRRVPEILCRPVAHNNLSSVLCLLSSEYGVAQ